jgi:hydroxyacylglutathione hydrolase
MKLGIVKSEGIAHHSYFLSDGEEAIVVDPRRDCLVYEDLATKSCTKTKYILETHRNEDYVGGSLELQNLTGAEVCHSKELDFKYGDLALNDGEMLSFGGLKIKVLHTPGHTNESLCYVVYRQNQSVASLVFTGDTLFAGSVGRTDLYGKNSQENQARKLYESIHEKLLPLGDHVIVYPGHGSGSVCGHDISDQDYSTIGYERRTNPYLRLDEDAFVEHSIDEELLTPPYFRRMEEVNLSGPPLLGRREVPKALSLSDFEGELEQANRVVVDTREPYAFSGSFVPGSINIWLEGTSVYPGWVLSNDQRLLFLNERRDDMKTVAFRLWRIGFDNMIGYLCNGMKSWQESGKPIDSIGSMSASSLKAELNAKKLLLLDVREPSEWEEGYINGAKRIYVGNLDEKADILPRDEPIAVICSVGNRASIAASILKKKGFRRVHNVLGGMTAWEKLSYSTERAAPHHKR